MGVEDYNRFILNGMNGNTCDECTPDGPTTSSPTTPPTNPPTTPPTTAPTTAPTCELHALISYK